MKRRFRYKVLSEFNPAQILLKHLYETKEIDRFGALLLCLAKLGRRMSAGSNSRKSLAAA
jgi:hypothetical protein